MKPGTRFGLSAIESVRFGAAGSRDSHSMRLDVRLINRIAVFVWCCCLAAASLLLLVAAHDSHSRWLSAKTPREGSLPGHRFVRLPVAWIEQLR